ncbi:helix-turn-helix domain-containing protein [Variovorax sp. Sphag1AA]|uniref:AraC family transcriptional regulator n=1 Tax=Variovorax sp. Sphag1AA TaxID=2587027 RepID=UPI001610980E|nr:helix-turn-helix domain-containing protein [Variovorax sp. Sphag1AA]MBB3182072.1 AraC-like DNA-binding protein [Variovorax sp. Sphag1AA]
MEPLSRHRVFSTGDVAAGEQFACRIWERNRTSIKEGSYGLRWNHLAGDRVTFSYIQHDCVVDLRAQGPLSDRFRFFLHDFGAMEHLTLRNPSVSNSDNVVVHSPGMDLRANLGPARFLLVSLDGHFVRSAMEQRFRRLSPYRDWLDVLPKSPALQSLRAFTCRMVAALDAPEPALLDAASAREHAERELLGLFTECLAEVAPGSVGRNESIGFLRVRRAEEWIDANLGEAIGVEEMAAAVGVGVRSLQMSFRQSRGYSPQEFLLRRRLEVARQMLTRARDGTTVTGIATTLGFFELGRFAQRYKRCFGETPSTTLARSIDL